MRRFLTLAIPGLLASGIPQITVIAGVMVASASRSAVSWLYYANRLIELPLGIVGIAVGTVLVPAFAHAIRSGDKRELAQVESRGIEIALGLALPAAVALARWPSRSCASCSSAAPSLPAIPPPPPRRSPPSRSAYPATCWSRRFRRCSLRARTPPRRCAPRLFGFVIAIIGSLALMPAFGHVGVAIADRRSPAGRAPACWAC